MQIDDKLLDALREIIGHGDRAEIVPVKDGVRLYVAKRREYRPKSDRR